MLEGSPVVWIGSARQSCPLVSQWSSATSLASSGDSYVPKTSLQSGQKTP